MQQENINKGLFEDQKKKAYERAKQVKSSSYGVEFYENEKINTTNFGLKTVQDLINLRKSDGKSQNLVAFENKQYDAILSPGTLLKDAKHVYISGVDSDNMAYIHIFGPKNVCTYYINKAQTKVCQLLDLFNKDPETLEKIEYQKVKYGIGNRLEPGLQINDGIAQSEVSKYIDEDEGIIKLLSY